MSYLVGIAGPSGAGKSVFCRLVQSTFQNVSRLKLDDFFVDIEHVARKNTFLNWDHPDSLKWSQLRKAAKDLKNGKHAMVPNYSRKEDRMIGEKCVLPAQIMLVDGFMTLADKELRDLLDLSIFFTLSEHSQIRRRKERQPWVEEGYLNEIMLPASREYIMPSKQFATHVINAEIPAQAVADQGIAIIRNVLGSQVKKLERRTQMKTTPLVARV